MSVRTLFPRVPRCYLSDTADWQAHFLGLKVQKTISRLTLITSQPSLANSAHLLRVIGFSHLLLKVKPMSLLPCRYFPRTEIPMPSFALPKFQAICSEIVLATRDPVPLTAGPRFSSNEIEHA